MTKTPKFTLPALPWRLGKGPTGTQKTGWDLVINQLNPGGWVIVVPDIFQTPQTELKGQTEKLIETLRKTGYTVISRDANGKHFESIRSINLPRHVGNMRVLEFTSNPPRHNSISGNVGICCRSRDPEPDAYRDQLSKCKQRNENGNCTTHTIIRFSI